MIKRRKGAGIKCPLLKNSIIYLLFTTHILVFSQGSEEKLYRIFQKEDSFTQITKFFKNTNIQFKSESAYVFILPPMGCPRCEGLINPIISILKKYDSETDVLIVAVYNKNKSVEHYLKRRNFKSDYNIITTQEFMNSFVLSVEPLRVPFLTKFNVKSGLLINFEPLLGFSADSLSVERFVKTGYSLEKISEQTNLEFKYEEFDTLQMESINKSAFDVITKVKLIDSEELPLSKILYYDISPSGRYLSVLDELSLYIQIYDLQTGKFINSIYPDISEEKTFIRVSDYIYDYLKQNNILNTMYFNHVFYDDTTLIISASIPNLLMEGDKIGYYNKSVLILKSIFDNNQYTIKQFSELPDTTFSLNHPDAQFISQVDLIYIPVSKGWPTKGTTIIHNLSEKDNPFDVNFYNFAPQCALYNLNGDFIHYVGKLDKLIENLRLGYVANTIIVKKINDSYWSTDRISGKIFIHNDSMLSNKIHEILIFENTITRSNINLEERPLEYIMETYKLNFKKQIIDFLAIKDFIYVLLKEDELYYLVTVEYQTNQISKEPVLRYVEGNELTNLKLRIKNNKLILIAFLENLDETYYLEIEKVCEFIK